MLKRHVVAAAGLVGLFTAPAFAENSADRAASDSSREARSAAAQCKKLSGAEKEQCLRQAERSGKQERATGATRSTSPGGAVSSESKQPADFGASGTSRR